MKKSIRNMVVGLWVLLLLSGVFVSKTAASSSTLSIGASLYWARASKTALNNEMGQLKYSGSNPQIFHAKMLLLDKKAVYCLEPHRMIYEYEGRAFINTGAAGNAVNQLAQSVQERLWQIAYYGYGYPGHEELIWWGATQQLVFETLGWQVKWYKSQSDATNQKNEVDLSQYTKVINELIQQHHLLPSFATKAIDLAEGETVVLTDENQVLANYLVEAADNVLVEKSGNTLKVTLQSLPDNPQNNTLIILKRIGGMRSGSSYVWHCQGSSLPQKLYDAGNSELLQTFLSINGQALKPLSIEVKKVDAENGKPLAGATFELYDIADEVHPCLIGFGKSDELGIISFSNVDYHGIYRLVEVGLPPGYDYYQGENSWLLQPDQQAYQEVWKIEIRNQLKRINLIIKKVDEENDSLLLAGAFFSIAEVELQKDGNYEIIYDYGSFATGALYLQDQAHVVYDIYSPEAMQLWQQNGKVQPNYTFVTNNDGEIVEYLPEGQWLVKKRDNEMTESRGFQIRLGAIYLENLKYGHSYRICETYSPLGYLLPPNNCSIRQLKSDYEHLEYEIIYENTRKIVPKTG